MNKQLDLMLRVKKILDKASSHICKNIWKEFKHLPHSKFVEKLSHEFQAEIVGDEEQENVTFEQSGQLIYTPLCEDIDSKMRLTIQLLSQKKEFNEVKHIIKNLLEQPLQAITEEFAYNLIIKIIRQLSVNNLVLYPLYCEKENSNCLFSVLTFYYACIAYLAGIDNFTPIKLVQKARIQPDIAFRNWMSVPAISLAQESARKAQFPDQKEQKLLESLIHEHPIKLLKWARESSVIYNLTLKNLHKVSSSKYLSLHSYHVLLTFENNRYRLAEVYEVDENNFGIKKATNPSAELCRLIQSVIDKVELDGKSGRSVNVRGIHSKSAVNVRTLGQSICEDVSYLAVQVSKHGKTVKNDEFRVIN